MTADAIQQYEIAGHMAQRLAANREAVRSYRQALRLWQSSGQSAALPDLAVRLYTEIGELLQPGGDAGGARAAFRQALSWTPAAEPIQRADLLRRIGKTWDAERQYDQALQFYADAEAALGSKCDASGSAWWQAWLQIQLERAWVCYWLDRYEEAEELTGQVGPIIEQTGTPEQQISFYLSLAGIQAHRARYRISDACLALLRRGLAISLQLGDPGHIAWARFVTGFSLLWHGDLEEAREQMEGALEVARQRGDAVHQSRCLTYLTILYRRCGDVVRTRDYAAQSLEAADRANMAEYQASARANQSWLAVA